MIAVRLEGRLGNQLFQYAFIYATSKKLDTSFYLDKSVDNLLIDKYFTIENDFLQYLDRYLFSIQGYKNVFSMHAKKAFYKTFRQIYLRNKTVNISNELPPAMGMSKLINGCIYTGFFQSEKYFENCKKQIRELFSIKKEYKNLFADLIKDLPVSAQKIVIHIRRGDYVDLDMTLPLSYYKNILAKANSETSLCIFISDDPEFVEKEFNYLKNKYISNNTEITDLQFLMNADICILSGSSFSWWGAWLNNKPDKIIYAPKNWIGYNTGKEHPAGIFDNLNTNWIVA